MAITIKDRLDVALPLLGDLVGDVNKRVTNLVSYITPEMFGADGTTTNDTAALLACQADPRVKVLNGAYKCNADLQLIDDAKWLGDGSIEFDGAGFYGDDTTDARHVELGALSLSRIGVAGYVFSFGSKSRRIKLDKTRITSSTGGGVYFSGSYLIDWISPYIVGCAGRAIEVETHVASDTGANAINLYGGEIQNCGFTNSVWAIYLENTKVFAFNGTTIEGVYGAVELGSECVGVKLDCYFEACDSGIISGGQVQAGTIQAGTLIYQRSDNRTTVIDIDDLIDYGIESNVGLYADPDDAGNPLIKLGELSTNRARGSIGKLRLTPLGEPKLLQNNTHRYGKQKVRTINPNATLSDTATSDTFTVDLAGLSWPSRFYDMSLIIDAASAGDARFAVRGVRADGSFTETYFQQLVTVPIGKSKVSLYGRLHDGGWPVVFPIYIEFLRYGDSVTDTAGVITLISASVITYENNLD